MQRGMLTVLGAAVLAMFAGGVWYVARSSEVGDRRLLRYGRRRYRPAPVNLPISPTVTTAPWGSGRGGTASGDPRLIANLACRAGPAIVSVQQIYAADRVRTILEPGVAPGGPVGPFQLSLQVLVPESKASDSMMIDRGTLSAIDSTGRSISAVDPPAPLAGVLRSAGGSLHTFFFGAPSPSATILRSVRGRARPIAPAAASGWGFEIANVPLPNSPRLYGEVSFVRVRPRGGSRLNQPVVLTGADVDGAEPLWSDEAAPLPPLRLVLPAAISTSLAAVMPKGTPKLRLAARPERSGHIMVEGSAGERPWRIRVWDYEPFIVVLPAPVAPDRIGALFRTSRSDQQVLLTTGPVVFATKRGRASGSIGVRIVGPGSRPFGPALVPIDVQQRANGVWGEPVSLLTPVRATGLALIANIAPGAYRLRFRMDAAQIANTGVVMRDVGQYVRSRYGVERGVWGAGVVQELEVLPGVRTYGRPVILTESRVR